MLVFGIFVFQFMQMMQSLPLLSVVQTPLSVLLSEWPRSHWLQVYQVNL